MKRAKEFSLRPASSPEITIHSDVATNIWLSVSIFSQFSIAWSRTGRNGKAIFAIYDRSIRKNSEYETRIRCIRRSASTCTLLGELRYGIGRAEFPSSLEDSSASDSGSITVRPCRHSPVICERFAVSRELIRRSPTGITDDVFCISQTMIFASLSRSWKRLE